MNTLKSENSSGRRGTVVVDGKTIAAGSLPWNPHPAFAGVSPAPGDRRRYRGRMSLHHIRIYPGCVIGDHSHAGMVEIHNVLTGEGRAVIAKKTIRHVPGVFGIMPAETMRRVVAGEQGILLPATFCPLPA